MNKKILALPLALFLVSNTASAVEVGGNARVNYSWKDFSETSKATSGDFDFNMFAIKLSEDWGDYGVTAEYRFTDSYDYLKYAYAYWNASEDLTLQLGVVSKAFGNKNFASHNWWYSLNYYLGFEDDWGAGANLAYKKGSWETEFSFHQGATYGASDYRHYAGTVSAGTIGDNTYNNEERNTFDLRQSYRLDGDGYQLLLGASLEYGQLYNRVENESGDTFTWAAHGDLSMGDWGLQLQYLDYSFDQYDDGEVDTNKIGIGAVTGFYEVASEGKILTANISKKFPMSWGTITLYNDYSVLQPDESSFDDSILNSTGFSVSYKQFFVYVDYYNAKNVLWLGGNSLGLEQASGDWNGRFNINVQYYF
ncbi:hypothetical protein FCL40_07885 [Ferrimonas sediminicola]|uniref:Phosphate-selective porin O and P n=1 Tax=Ferrimonas sediminicola TaxID=2569538 RepID=A0A4U1BDN2_9GAMM|nr:hypothetical protein [Ferrimonas sediminicola]TKB49249.1 hypothetical protein FCL40_07885 [Ferrimonas sediminicola]